MAKVIFNSMVKSVHGRFEKLVFRRTPGGGLSIIKAADMSKVKWSRAQKANRERFGQAVEYARAAMADPKVRALYEKKAAKENKRPYGMAISDFCKGNNLLSGKRK